MKKIYKIWGLDGIDEAEALCPAMGIEPEEEFEELETTTQNLIKAAQKTAEVLPDGDYELHSSESLFARLYELDENEEFNDEAYGDVDYRLCLRYSVRGKHADDFTVVIQATNGGVVVIGETEDIDELLPKGLE